MSKMKLTLGYMAALLLFTACTQDEAGTLPDGTQPLKLTAAIGGEVATRTTADGTWEEEDAITLSIDANTYTYQYEGTDWTSSAPYFWQAEDDAIFVSAYSFGGETGDYAVQADQSTDDSYLSGDLLYAPEVEVTYGEEASLIFYHQTAKVVVNIKKEGIMETNPTHEVAIQGALSGTFTAPTGEETYGTWTTDVSEGSITPQSITPANSEYAASYQALLIPQTIGDAFISITIDDKTYRYTPETGTTLQPGHVYTYNITVFSYGLEVQVTESIDWSATNTGNGNITLTDKYDAATNTYYAYTAKGLKEWAEKAKTDLTAKCLLFDDIDFNNETWTPVGSSDNGFTGTFDGQGHTIRNMRIIGTGYVGLFGYIEEGGTVQNVEFKSIEIPQNANNQYVGVVAGYNDGIISHCQIVDGTAYINNTVGRIGGIAGQNYGTISCCEVVDYILNGMQSSAYVGGIAGLNGVEGRIEACSFTDIIYAANYGGGIVGQNDGDIRACWADANFAGSGNNGGVCGYFSDGDITACYWNSSGSGINGIGYNPNGMTDDTYKVDGNPYTWIVAADFMNYELGTDFGWYWQTSDQNTPPTLVEVDN